MTEGVSNELRAKLMEQLSALTKLKKTLHEFQRLFASESLTTRVLVAYVKLFRFLIYEGLGTLQLAERGATELVRYLAQEGRVVVALVMSEIGNIRALPDISGTLVRRLLAAAQYGSLHALLHILHPLRHEIMWVRMQYAVLLRALHRHFNPPPSPSDAPAPRVEEWELISPANVLQNLGIGSPADSAGHLPGGCASFPDDDFPIEAIDDYDDALREITRWLED